MITVLILQISSTLLMTGVIWIIQLVNYPSFSKVGANNFQKYHASHTFWITPIVAPLMVVELITSIILVGYPPIEIGQKLLWFGLVMAFIIWALTFLLHVPLHNRLAEGFDAETHSRLVKTNWIRTIAWSLRAILVICFAFKVIRV